MKLLSILVLAMFGLPSYGKKDLPSTLSETRSEEWAARDRVRAEQWVARKRARDEEWAARESEEQAESRRDSTLLESYSSSNKEEPPLELTIREAQANLEEAQRVYAEAKASKSETEIAKAREDVQEALRILNITYKRPAHILLSGSLEDTIAPIAKSQAEVAKAEANLEEAKASKSEEEITLAERALRKAQIELTISEEYVLLKKAQYDKLGNENRARASINVILARRYVQDAIRIRNLILEQESLEAAGTNNCAVCDSDTVQIGRDEDSNPRTDIRSIRGSSHSGSRL